MYFSDETQKQVKILFYNLYIIENIEAYLESENWYCFFGPAQQEFESFHKEYISSPHESLSKLLKIETELSPSPDKAESELLSDLLISHNKTIKDSVFRLLREKLIQTPLKWLTKELLLWIPIALITIGFLKALIISYTLDTPLTILFSIQDYWDYGIEMTHGFVFSIIIMLLSVWVAFYFVEKRKFEYIEQYINTDPRLANRADKSSGKWMIILIGICVILLTAAFVGPVLFPAYLSVFLILLVVGIVIFALIYFRSLSSHKHNPVISFLILSCIFYTILNLWIIPKQFDQKNLHSSLPTKISITVDPPLPNHLRYVMSTTKHHIFLDENRITLIPVSNVTKIEINSDQ